jgi:hypothetical protein
MRFVRALVTLETGCVLRPLLRQPSLAGGWFGLKLFIDAQAWIGVPSIEKSSLDNNCFTRSCDSIAVRNLAASRPPPVGRGFWKNPNGPTRVVDPNADKPATG